MKDKIAFALISIGLVALYKEQIMQEENMQIIKELLYTYWPWGFIALGIIIKIEKKSKKS